MKIIAKIITVFKWIFILTGMFISAVWFFGSLFFEKSPNVLGAAFLLSGGAYCFYKLGVFKKIKKGDSANEYP